MLLNAAVTFHNVWPTPWITTRHELSIDVAVALLLLAAYSEVFRPPRRIFIAGLTLITLAMFIGRYAEVTAPALYGRPVNVYWDAQHLPKVAAMLARAASPWVLAAATVGLVGLLAALTAALYWCWAQVARGVSASAPRRMLGAVAAVVVGVYVLSSALNWPLRYRYSVPVSATYGQQAAFLFNALTESEQELPIEPLAQTDLERVRGADVLLMFLESYGAVAYDDAAISQIVAPARVALDAAAAATGRQVVSAFVESPTFGGGSWLAHSTLMSGTEVTDPGSYDLLLTQDRETLPKLFAAGGYRAIAWMPGLRKAWPEGDFYGFDAIYGEREIDYRGPDFGWWRIPDQYALAKLDATELQPVARAPLFAFLPTINTHMPFRPTPPLQPVWPRLLTDDPYDAAATAASLATESEWAHLGTAYAESVAYTFSYLASYMLERPSADFVLVLIGDHQPPSSVSGQGSRWDVPVHVITARGDIIEALRAAGFTQGLDIDSSTSPLGRMPALTATVLRALDSGDDPPSPTSGYSPQENLSD